MRLNFYIISYTIPGFLRIIPPWSWVIKIALRWIHEQGVSFLVKSLNKERMQQNLEIFDWSLTQDELNKISKTPQQKHLYLIDSFVTEANAFLAEIDADLSFQ
ncbi:NADPH-dependent codeinone reductase 1-4 [Artemisia annua]|uniref:NADPH-dependent codeinone reductase 1-4 n=1 Tax=Artemisia annua TaxID=35608 RepID=A0A2U1L477_ARTAN|nr:NADPH-dependent codeinone reductase 1-4 [Artemisia annua]